MLQQAATVPHDWLAIVVSGLVGAITGGGGVAWITAWQNRRKIPAEIHETKSRAGLTLVKANRSAAELVLETGNTLFALQEKAIKLRDDLAVAEQRASANEIAADLKDLQLERCREILDKHGLREELATIFKENDEDIINK